MRKVVEGGRVLPMQEVGCVVIMGVWWNVINVNVRLLVLTRHQAVLNYWRTSGGLLVVSRNFLENEPT